MKYNILLLVGHLSFLTACSGGIPLVKDGEEIRLSRDYLAYELISPDGNVSHLVGTIHVRKQGDPGLSGGLLNAFEKSDVLFLEINPDEMARSGNLVRALNAHAVLPNNQKLSATIPPELFLTLSRRLGSLGLDIRVLEVYQPWFVSVTATTALILREGFRPEYGLDTTLAGQARALNKMIGGLETLDEQFSAFSRAPIEEQIRDLEALVREWETIPLELNGLREAYERRDTARLLDRLAEASAEEPEQLRRLIEERNPRMTEAIIQASKNGDKLFIAVGAMHVIGPNSIPVMLVERGWKVSEVAY